MLIIFLFTFLNINSQEICGTIEYEVKGYKTIYFKMIFNDNFSFNTEKEVKLSDNEKETHKSEGSVTNKIIEGRRNLTPIFLYNDKQNFYFNEEFIDGEIAVVKEDKITWKWKILSETKKIGNFTCQKAQTTFRGSAFTAWFTNEIPVPFGPWKAKDLPGLILELFDSNEIMHITATKVTLKSKEKCVFPINEKTLKKAVSIQSYLNTQKKKDKEYFARLNSKLPKGSKPFKLAEDCEDCPKEIKLENFNEKK